MTTRSDLDLKLFDAVDRLGRALRVLRQREATDRGLTTLQVLLLEELRSSTQRSTNHLAERLDTTQPTVSDALAALQAKGLVTRSKSVEDARVTVTTLTEQGEDVAEQIVAAIASKLAPHSGAPTLERGVALEVLLREIERLYQSGAISITRNCLSCRHFAPPSTGDAHCRLLNLPLPPPNLRVDCPEHERAPNAVRAPQR